MVLDRSIAFRIGHLFDQLSRWNPQCPRNLAKGLGGRDVVGVSEHALDRVVGHIRAPLEFAHTDAFLSGDFFHA